MNPFFRFFLFFSLPLVASDINFTIFENGFNQQTALEKPTVYIFAHGVMESHKQAKIMHRIVAGGHPIATFNFKDATEKKVPYPHKTYLGQQHDIEHLKQAHDVVRSQFPGSSIVLIGISRGAATILNYLALYRPNDVHAAIVESPFDTMLSVFKHLLKRFWLYNVPYSESFAAVIGENIFYNVDWDGPFPIDHVTEIPKHIPLLFVHAKTDLVVPIESSKKLYATLKKAGYRRVYFLELPSGKHGKVINGPDNDLYCYIAHALYKKYNLPHDPIMAKEGKRLFKLAKPKISEPVPKNRGKNSIVAQYA